MRTLLLVGVFLRVALSWARTHRDRYGCTLLTFFRVDQPGQVFKEPAQFIRNFVDYVTFLTTHNNLPFLQEALPVW
jgi:hypothetical protein